MVDQPITYIPIAVGPDDVDVDLTGEVNDSVIASVLIALTTTFHDVLKEQGRLDAKEGHVALEPKGDS